MQESTRRFLQRQLEKQFDNINFIKVRGKVYIYGNSFKKEDIIRENI